MRAARFAAAASVTALVTLGAGSAAAVDASTTDYHLIREVEYAARFAAEVDPLWSQRVVRGAFTGVGDVRLAYAAAVVPDARAAVVIVTGRTENLLKYEEVVADLVRQRYTVYVYDHRGQGFSERMLREDPQKGYVRRFDDYVEDLQTFIERVVLHSSGPTLPLLLLAHSMGGGIATLHLERFPGTFVAAALSSPMHQPNAKIVFSADTSCTWLGATGGFFGESWVAGIPRPYAHGPFDPATNDYTHSAVRWAQVLKVESAHPNVRLGGVTRRWAGEACSASKRMIDDAGAVRTPVLVLQAGADTAVTSDGQNAFCAALQRRDGPTCETGRPVRIEGAHHELLIEADAYRIPAMTAILNFFDTRLANR